MLRWIVVVLFLVPAGLRAETIYKCVGAKGSLSYQSQPCPASARRATAKVYGAIYEDPAAERRVEQIRREMDARSREFRRAPSRYRSGGSYAQRDRQRSDCDAAKANRERKLETVGMSRNFDLLRQLDDQVARTCKNL